ncbi:MAG TPA: SGNH/GDSL hydrolase family protein, partial [Solirubrobacterales bacterium]|nr:SGNH/GDSL hydrolase family protein [Solirubrobacterales bacterium]
DRSSQPLTRAAGHRVCGSLAQLRVRPGARIAVELPPCAGDTRWALPTQTERGKLRLRGNRLVYRAPKKFRGTVSANLMAAPAPGIPATRKTAPAVPVQITIGTPKAPVVRALGDSVTAGFGYYEHGELMGISSLLSCRPGETSYDDACSSNSKVRSNKVAKVEYASDYGLSNNVSWAAQWANTHGVTDFKNFAVSGSEPSDWYGKGQFAATTKQLIGEDPDYVLLTMGANPLLSNMLFGIGDIGCGIWADVTGRFKQCIEEEFAAIKLHENLKSLYTTLVKGTDAEIFVMQYHLSIPTAALYGVEQIAQMGAMMNEEIAKAAKEVSPTRITVVSPPHFNVGLSLGQVYPSKYKCEGELFSSIVDGRSVQSTASQDEMEGLHPVEFCAAEEGEEPWVISGDTGIHPSADGYTQMAAKVPPPK